MTPINEAVRNKEEEISHQPEGKNEFLRALGILCGTFIYAFGVNRFLRPLHLYSGGLMGFSQLFARLLQDFAGISAAHIDLAGIIYYAINIPCLIIAFFSMRKRFLVKTIYTVTCLSLFMSIIPIPTESILDEKVASCLAAGCIAGIGIGIILRMGTSDGGMDLIGMVLIQKQKHVSVGRLNIMTNIVLYLICILLYDVPTVLYSLFYSVVCSLVCDRLHAQNINMQVLIVTQLQDIRELEVEIMGELSHGLTRWQATGAFTEKPETILMTVVSKQELPRLRTIVHQKDPKAFVLISEGVNVDGYFLRKVT